MEELFKENPADRDLFFTSFATDIGSQLDQLKFEFDAIENGTILEEEEVDGKEAEIESMSLESKVNRELEKNIIATTDSVEKKEDDGKRNRVYSLSIQRAFSTVSLMTNFKANFWKHRKGRHHKHDDKLGNGDVEHNGRQRRASTSSEKNNNSPPDIKVNGESEGRTTIYSTIPRLMSNKVSRSKTMSPSTKRPTENLTTGELEPIQRSESGNLYSPPVVVDGQLVYDYQYQTPSIPAEGSPGTKTPKKLNRRNSVSRFLRLRKSPRKTPKSTETTPLKVLYQKTVLSRSEPGSINDVGANGRTASTSSNDKEQNETTPKKET